MKLSRMDTETNNLKYGKRNGAEQLETVPNRFVLTVNAVNERLWLLVK